MDKTYTKKIEKKNYDSKLLNTLIELDDLVIFWNW